MKQTCDTCNNELNATRDPDTLNCVHCGVTTPASITKTYQALTSDTTVSKIAEHTVILLLYTTGVIMLTVLVAQAL